MIVFRIANRDSVVFGQSQLRKSSEQSGGLVHTGRQNHDRALVVDHLKFKSQMVNDLEHSGVLRFLSGHDGAADAQRLHMALAKGIDECRRWSFPEHLRITARWAIEQSAVFCDDSFKEAVFWKCLQ